ncbi:MAG: hypothetical protein AAFN30_14320 [Actinomycetota bacterium]
MELLLLFGAMIVVAMLFIWSLTRQTGYRVKNRDVPKVERQGRSANRTGPDLKDMLD